MDIFFFFVLKRWGNVCWKRYVQRIDGPSRSWRSIWHQKIFRPNWPSPSSLGWLPQHSFCNIHIIPLFLLLILDFLVFKGYATIQCNSISRMASMCNRSILCSYWRKIRISSFSFLIFFFFPQKIGFCKIKWSLVAIDSHRHSSLFVFWKLWFDVRNIFERFLIQIYFF